MEAMARHDHRDADSGQYHEVPTSGDPTRYAGDDVPLSGQIDHPPLDGEPFGREIESGWEPVEDLPVDYK
jgi:hypothetical protein